MRACEINRFIVPVTEIAGVSGADPQRTGIEYAWIGHNKNPPAFVVRLPLTGQRVGGMLET